MSDQLPTQGQVPPEVVEQPAAPQQRPESRGQLVLREILGGSALGTVLAVFLALLAGAILIAATNEEVQEASGYFFARPGATVGAIWDAVAGAYSSLFQGSVYNFRAPDLLTGFRPLGNTIVFATPLIAAGLGVAIAFRVGLFNIGGQGQILVAAAAAGFVGFAVPLPPGVHLLIAVVAGIVAGALWGGIVGVLKARTGAHEVIVTIMLNYIAVALLEYLVRTPGLLQDPNNNTPKTAPMLETAVFPTLTIGGVSSPAHLGFVVAIALTVLAWYLLNRSSLGFRFRAVGENPSAARVAGIDVKSVYVRAMLIAAGFVGFAGASQVLGTETDGFSAGIDAGVGFDAITVALLGRSRPWGVFGAGILFGALKAGSFRMSASNDVPNEIVFIVQSLIVLFIAAPPLVRAIFRLPAPSGVSVFRSSQPSGKKAVVTK